MVRNQKARLRAMVTVYHTHPGLTVTEMSGALSDFIWGFWNFSLWKDSSADYRVRLSFFLLALWLYQPPLSWPPKRRWETWDDDPWYVTVRFSLTTSTVLTLPLAFEVWVIRVCTWVSEVRTWSLSSFLGVHTHPVRTFSFGHVLLLRRGLRIFFVELWPFEYKNVVLECCFSPFSGSVLGRAKNQPEVYKLCPRPILWRAQPLIFHLCNGAGCPSLIPGSCKSLQLQRMRMTTTVGRWGAGELPPWLRIFALSCDIWRTGVVRVAECPGASSSIPEPSPGITYACVPVSVRLWSLTPCCGLARRCPCRSTERVKHFVFLWR